MTILNYNSGVDFEDLNLKARRRKMKNDNTGSLATLGFNPHSVRGHRLPKSKSSKPSKDFQIRKLSSNTRLKQNKRNHT